MLSLVAVFLLTLLAVDVFISVRAKNRLQNGGDAAVLAAAHRQGEIINEIGELNMRHIKAALKNDSNECAHIERMQRRLALIEPVYALRFASDAAEKNGIEQNEDISALLFMHVKDVRTIYAPQSSGDYDPFPESYPGAWEDYANAIAAVATGGLAAGPDNIAFYCGLGNHVLLKTAFYDAIAGEDWCWFWFYEMELLKNYNSYGDWAPLPTDWHNSTENSEIFSLHLNAKRCALTDAIPIENIVYIANAYGNMRLKTEDFIDEDGNRKDCELLEDPMQTWFFFDPQLWGPWFNGKTLYGDEDGEDYEFPVVGTIKDEYNVRGCAAVCSTKKENIESLTTGTSHRNAWVAAAKPFGTVITPEGDAAPVTALGRLVVPCMTDTRLVSVDSVTESSFRTSELDWIAHIRHHLPAYLQYGPKNNGGCWYCAQLKKWERPSVRKRALHWLKYHSGQCIRPVSGGSSGEGGARHGH